MKYDTEVAVGYAADKLASFLECAERDTKEIIQSNDIPTTVAHFAALRDRVKDLATRVSALQKHVDLLSYEILPTMFGNQNVKTINIEGVGRVTINVRWAATTLSKERAFEWLRATGNDGIIIETIPAQTLAAFAKACHLEGKPLPADIFKVGTAQHVSITKNGSGGDE